MVQESFKSRIGFMTMLTIMIWVILTRILKMHAQFLEGPQSTLIHEEGGQADLQPRQVRFNIATAKLCKIVILVS